MMELNLPRQTVNRAERHWAQQLETQANAWKAAKPDARSVTDRGVTVVYRRKRSRLRKEIQATRAGNPS